MVTARCCKKQEAGQPEKVVQPLAFCGICVYEIKQIIPEDFVAVLLAVASGIATLRKE